ncbi:hypothetical protein GCM10023219_22860 [Stakelama sediminis]|uniref:STAS/SEC14 domain-containing protein n=1 Tax=Stakelama sediminis TaxID=463200 RepID=A0A840YZJ7_9SPHN|nr:STAS/SEC14 domain-containing protein [Stakelama sediminis]MBB5719241.1 hypothetical protein [Stakelama sediminis]
MIDIDFHTRGLAILRPEGALSKSDFEALARAIDTHINETDTIPNLVIRVDRLPHWDSIGALSQHLHLIREHGAIIAKVAVVGDSPLLTLAPEIAGHFVKATIRRFPADKFEAAKAWALAADDDPGRFEEIDGLPADVIAIRAVGVITAQDYRDTLIPMVEAKLKTHDTIKCLVVLDSDYAAYSGDAAWEDMKLGIRHWNAFRRIAVVSDIGWIVKAVRLFAPIMPGAVKTFPVAELDAAKAWVVR